MYNRITQTPQSEVNATLDATVILDKLADAAQYLSDQSPRHSTISFPPADRLLEFFREIYSTPRFSFPPEHNV